MTELRTGALCQNFTFINWYQINQNCELGIFFSKLKATREHAFLVFFKLVFLCPPVSSIYSTGVTVKCNCLCFYGIYTCAIHELPRKILQVSNAQCLKMTKMSKKTLLLFFNYFFYTRSKYKVLIWFLVPKSKFFVEGNFFVGVVKAEIDERASINQMYFTCRLSSDLNRCST